MPARKKQGLFKTGTIALGITATLLMVIDHREHLDGYDYTLFGLIVLSFVALLVGSRRGPF